MPRYSARVRTPDETEVVKAMPRQRAIALLSIALLAGLLVLLLNRYALMPWLRDYLTVADRSTGLLRFRQVMAVVALVPLAGATIPALQAWNILRTGQFPAPDAWVWRDTPVRRGRAAQLRAVLLSLCALALVVGAAGLAWLPWTL
jgi:hypothetical protein